MKKITKIAIIVVAAAAVLALLFTKVPFLNEFARNVFNGNNQPAVSETVDTNADASETTDSVESENSNPAQQPTEDTNESETESAESEEVKANIPVYADVEAYLYAIIANEYNAINLAPEKALVYDVRPDQFVNAEIPEYIEVLMMVNGEGKFTVLQEGFDLEEKVEYDLETLPVFKMCSDKEHVESWDEDMGPFHYHVVEGNQSLKGDMFTRNEGTVAKVILDAEAIEMLISAGQYWYNGDVATTGIRICGAFYVAPKPVVPEDTKPEVKNYTVTLKHVTEDGKSFGIADKTFTVKEGTNYTATAQKLYTMANGDKYTLVKYSSNNGSAVKGNVTIYAYYNYEAYVAPKPEVKNYTVTLKHVTEDGKSFGIADKTFTVKEGTNYTATAQKLYTMANGDKYTLVKYSSNNGSAVKGNVTIYAYYNYEAYVAPLKDYTVSFEMSSTVNGRTLPYAVTKLTPEAITVKEGTKLTFSELAGKIVDVNGGKWICTGYDPKSVTVNGNITVKVLWKYEADQVIIIPVPEVEYHTVEINYVTYDGSNVPAKVLEGLTKAMTVKEGEKFSLNMSGFSYDYNGKTYLYDTISRNNFIVTGDCEVTVYFIEKLTLSDDYPTDNEPEHTVPEDNTPEHTVPGTGTTEDPSDDNPLDDDRTDHPEDDNNDVIPEEDYNHPKADEDTQKELDDLFGKRTDEVEDNTPEHSEQPELTLAPVVEEVEEEEEVVEETLTFAPVVTETESTDGVENMHSAIVTETTNVDETENALSLAPVAETTEVEEETESLSLMPVAEEAAEETVEEEQGLSFAPVVDDSEVADQDTQNELDAMFGGRE